MNFTLRFPIDLFFFTRYNYKLMKKFEERLIRLEEISTKIKEPNLPLEQAFAFFEEGVKLAGSLEKDIEKLEGKVQILMNGGELAADDDAEKTEKAEKKEPAFELFSEEDLT